MVKLSVFIYVKIFLYKFGLIFAQIVSYSGFGCGFNFTHFGLIIIVIRTFDYSTSGVHKNLPFICFTFFIIHFYHILIVVKKIMLAFIRVALRKGSL